MVTARVTTTIYVEFVGVMSVRVVIIIYVEFVGVVGVGGVNIGGRPFRCGGQMGCLTLAVEDYVNDDDCDKVAEEHKDKNGGEVPFSLHK
jgi:hypothetical protein